MRRFPTLALIASLCAGLAGCVTTNEPLPDPAAVARANAGLHKLDQQKVRLSIARIVEESNSWRGILDGGAPRIGNSKIGGPLDRIGRNGERHLEYCVSAAILPFTILPKSAHVTVKQQPDGQTRITVSIKANGGSCSGADQPFPEFEQLRNQRRKAMGKDA